MVIRHADDHRYRRAQGCRGRGPRHLRLARGDPEGRRHVRRRHRRPPVDPRRRRPCEGHAVRRHDRAWLPDAQPRPVPQQPGLQDGRLRVRPQLRPQQGPLPGAVPIPSKVRASPRSRRSRTSRAAPSACSRSPSSAREPTSRCASPRASCASTPARVGHNRRRTPKGGVHAPLRSQRRSAPRRPRPGRLRGVLPASCR